MLDNDGLVRKSRRWKIACSAMLLCKVAFAQPAPNAREHFSRGLELARRDEFEAAAREFEAAYRTSPNYAVLYNLGQMYLALGRPVDGLESFETYLENGGDNVTPARRAEVLALISANKKRVGYISLSVAPAESQVFIDGRLIEQSALRVPIALEAGVHGIVASKPGCSPFMGRVDIESQRTVPFAVNLAPEKTLAPSIEVGQLSVEHPVPAVTILVDGVAIDGSRPQPLLLPLGIHQITCQRDGYRPFEERVEVVEQRLASVSCELTPIAKLPPSEVGILTFSITEPGAEVRVDGRRTPSTVRVPSGPHSVTIHRWGFVDWAQTVTARPGFPEIIAVRLQATPERARELERTARSRRSWAYVIGGAGLALLGTGAALYLGNNHRYQAWERDRDGLSRDIRDSSYRGDLSQRAMAVRETAVSIRAQDDAALGAALLGATLTSYAVVSWFGSK